MQLKIHSRALYEVPQPTTALLMMEASNGGGQRVENSELAINPSVPLAQCRDLYGNSFRIAQFPQGRMEIEYRATVETRHSIVADDSLQAIPIDRLPAEAHIMTLPSRYCESDRLAKVAADLFGNFQGSILVNAICDWIRTRVTYAYGYTNSSTSAVDTLTERIGVCRDFSHLAIAFCRAMSIPARYVAAYCWELDPPDFHGFFQAYLPAPLGATEVGQWYDFDATYGHPRRGLALIAHGRDAADTAMATFYGNVPLLEQEVHVLGLEHEAEGNGTYR